MAALGQISNVYDDQPYQDFANLSMGQSTQSLVAGDRAAAYADPFMGERKNYQERLRNLIANPGAQESSPFFKYLMETQMNQVNANNAARGLTRSGRGAMALQDRAAGVASQSYFPQVQALTQLAQGGASPAAAGISYERGIGRSQDQAQMAAAARAAGQQRPVTAPAAAPVAAPAPQQPNTGFGLPYSGGNANGYGYTDATTPGYTPSANAGTGYMSTNGKTTNFAPTPSYGGMGGNWDMSNNPYASTSPINVTTTEQPQQPAYDPYGGYDPYSGDTGSSGYSDFGYGGGY